MTNLADPTAPPRADLERVFAHLIAEGRGLNAPLATATDQLAAVRHLMDCYADINPRPPLTGVTVHPAVADEFDAEWLVPENVGTGRRIVYLHGGAWISGGAQSHRPLAAALAQVTHSELLLVEYRLAPEHPFPAGLLDCIAACQWAAENGPNGASSPQSLVLAGDSAGGNLSAAVCMALIEKQARIPDRLVLLSPNLDNSRNAERDARYDPISNADKLDAVAALYTGGAVALSDPRVSPIGIPGPHLRRFPPTLLQVSGAEFLLWDSRRFAERLAEEGRRVVLSVWPDMPHVWHLFIDQLPEADASLKEIAHFLR